MIALLASCWYLNGCRENVLLALLTAAPWHTPISHLPKEKDRQFTQITAGLEVPAAGYRKKQLLKYYEIMLLGLKPQGRLYNASATSALQ